MRANLDLRQFGHTGEMYSADVADNTAATLCVIPTGARVTNVIVASAVISSGAYITELAWSASGTTVTVTPQLSSASETGKASYIVTFAR